MKQKPTPPCLRAWYSYVLLGMLTLGLLTASSLTYAQSSVLDKKVTYKASNKSLLSAIKEIRTMVKVRFTYNEDQLKKQPPVTINVKAENLGQVLQRMLTGTNLKFVEEFGGILIYPEQETEVTKGKLNHLFTGQVTDKDNNPIPGVNIQGLNTKVGTVTTADGTFSLLLLQGEPVRFSSIGMQPQTLFPKNDYSFQKVQMETATTQIQEVLVNGYQKIEPRLATGAYFKLNATDIMEPGVPTVDKMLQGKVPGLLIVNTSGSVNAAPTIRMRGTSTFLGNAAPLWVIDGIIKYDPVQIPTENLKNLIGGNFELMGNAISGLNPYDIENITFLRDAAATSIYGVRAANGVIVVTTRRGKIGPAQISYGANVSFTRRPSYNDYNLMNSAQRISLSKEIFEDGLPVFQYNAPVTDDSYEAAVQQFYQRKITEEVFNSKVAELSARNTDWFKLLFDNAVSNNHYLSINGGNNNTTYYTSLGYSKDQGSAKLDKNEKFTLSGNLTTKIGKQLNMTLNYGGFYTKKSGYFDAAVNPFNYAYSTSRALNPNDFYFMKYFVRAPTNISSPLHFNMLNELENTHNEEGGHSFFTNLQLQYNLGRGWRIEELIGATITSSNKLSYATDKSFFIANRRGWDYDTLVSDREMKASYLPAGGIGISSSTTDLTISTRSSINYNTSLRDERDAVYLSIGAETNSQLSKGLMLQQSGFFPDRGMMFYPNAIGSIRYGMNKLYDAKVNSLGVYFSSGYNINNRYTLSAVVRSDASNRFGQYANQKFLPNFSLGSSWNIKNENWLSQNRLISELSMNVSYGSQGNVVSQVGPDIIASYTSDAENSINIYNRSKVSLSSLPYPDLRWEKTNQLDAGMNLGILRNKIAATLHVYKKWGHDLLVEHPVAYENGVSTTYINGGSMNNSGIDLTLRIAPIQTKDITLALNTNYAINYNKVLDTTFRSTIANYLAGNAYANGRAVDGFYSIPYGGLDNNGLPILRYTSDKMLPATEYLVYSGQRLPKFQGGFSLMFRYKNLTLSGNFTYQLGNHVRLNPLFTGRTAGNRVPTSEANANTQLVNRWRKPGDELKTDIPGLRDYMTPPAVFLPVLGLANSQERVSLYSLYDLADTRVVRGDFLKCKSINATYSFKPGVLQQYRLKGAALNFSVANPFYLASKRLEGQDPETNGLGTASLPITPAFTGGFNVTF